MKITKTITLDRHDFNRIRDRVLDVFDIEVSDKQIKKLLTLCPDWDGIMDTLGESEVMGAICRHFIGMSVPMYGSPQEYKDAFWKKAEESKEAVIKFIS